MSFDVELAVQQATAALLDLGARVLPGHLAGGAADLEVEVGDDRLAFEVKSAGRLQRPNAVLDRQELVRSQWTGTAASAPLLLVVADRVDPAARRELRDAGVGYLDLAARHLVLHAPGLIIDADVDLDEQLVPDLDRGLRSPYTDVGVQVAYRALRHPEVPVPVRATASTLGVSATQVSTVCRALIGEGLLNEHREVADPPALFWALAEHWDSPPETRASLARAELAGAVHVGDEAALHWHAPIVAVLGEPLLHLPIRRYLPSPADGEAAARVTVAPAPEAAEPAGYDANRGPVAAPLAVALQLAQDRGRGREILSEWTPPASAGQVRVW